MTLHRAAPGIAGLVGAAGVALAARAAHGGGNVAVLAIAAQFLLVHAAALLALGAWLPQAGPRRAGLMGIALILMALAAMLFAADLTIFGMFGHSLFPFAAPLGGLGMIAAWLLVAAAGLRAP
ncbi:MAG: DUF423 domain-containing protein [Hyphomicrobiales bacterium]|nr:DUF423 domain-containing protein [Hyphomicrobiales bacterium]